MVFVSHSQFAAPSVPNTTFATALKEWAVAVEALCQGKALMLLRKGGIRDRGENFAVSQRRVWLYPTYEHQQPELLQSKYASQVQPVPAGWHPETVPISGWAEIDCIFPVTDPSALPALEPFHVWNETFVEQRLAWKPQKMLYALVLRSHRLRQPYELPYRSQYGGCRSWIELETALKAKPSQPALSQADYEEQVAAIDTQFTRSQSAISQ